MKVAHPLIWILLQLCCKHVGGFFMIWPFFQCNLAFLFYGFNVSDFSRFPEYYRDDGFVFLSQAGQYTGGEDVAEYTKFVSGDFSPYFEEVEESVEIDFNYVGYDWKGNRCQFLALAPFVSTTNPDTTLARVKTKTVAATKFTFEYYEQYFPETFVYFNAGYLDWLFGTMFNSDKTREYICSVYQGSCLNDIEQVEDCEAELANLPPIEGEFASFTGNSSGCRALHADFAESNPSVHCPHISLAPKEDTKGRLVCQTRSTVTPEDLFTPDEIQWFREYSEDMGIDFDEGYVVLED